MTDLIECKERIADSIRHSQTPESLSDINLVVLGSEGVGKSTLVQKALDLDATTASVGQRKLFVKGEDYFVRLFEIAIEDVEWDEEEHSVIWPETIEDKMMPRIDGAFVLYDIKQRGSLDSVPGLLSKSTCFLEQGQV